MSLLVFVQFTLCFITHDDDLLRKSQKSTKYMSTQLKNPTELVCESPINETELDSQQVNESNIIVVLAENVSSAVRDSRYY